MEKTVEKRSLRNVNEPFEAVFNAAVTTQVVSQRLLKR